MGELIECVKCLYKSNHPHGLVFDEDGICSGCKTHKEKFDLNWDQRLGLLEDLLAQYKKKNSNYDCVIPIRGTPEYFYVLDLVKNKFGMNPLIAVYNSQFNSESGIRNLDLIREAFDVDIVHYTSNPEIYRSTIRETLVRFNSMRWPYLAGETQFPVQVAVEKSIPLIIWPYHQPTEQVGVHSYLHENEMTRRSRHEFELMGYEPSDLLGVGSMLSNSDIEDYHYPSNINLQKKKIRGIYLSNYIPWDSRLYSEQMIAKFSAVGSKNVRTFDTYDRIDDMAYMTIHDIIKFAKLGYSRVTDNLCREIRFGRIIKDNAKQIEHYYQSQIPKDETEIFLEWLGMSFKGFEWFLEQLEFKFDQLDNPIDLNSEQMSFIESFDNCDRDVFKRNEFIIFGKGLSV